MKSDLPPPIDDASAWTGPAMAQRSDWIETLDADETAEVEVASRALAERGTDLRCLQVGGLPAAAAGPAPGAVPARGA